MFILMPSLTLQPPTWPDVADGRAESGRKIVVGEDVEGEGQLMGELRHGGRHPMGEIDAAGSDAERDASVRHAGEAEVEEVAAEIVLSPRQVGEERGKEATPGVVGSGEEPVGQVVTPLAEIAGKVSREMGEHPCGIVGLLRVGRRDGRTEHIAEDGLASRGAYPGDDAFDVVGMQANGKIGHWRND